jgi:arylsulfatase A-like enzyme
MQPESTRTPRQHPRQLLLLAVWFGLATGTLALGIQLGLLRYAHLRSSTPLGLEIGWLNAPLVDALSFGGIGVVSYLAASRWPRLVPFRLLAFTLAFVAFLSLLLLIPGIAFYSLALLAGGAAVQTARWMSANQLSVFRACRVSCPWLIALAVGLTIWDIGSPRIIDAWGRSRLPAPRADAPNVLLIVLDTVRAESLSAYGFQEPTSPWLEEFAKQSVLFEHAMSTSPWTLPAHATLFTGRAPRDLSADWESALDRTHPTLAEMFAARGYVTGGFVANYDYASGRTGLDRGFLSYDDHTAIKNIAGHTYDSPTRTSSSVGRLGPPQVRRILDNLAHKNAPALNREFLNWLARRDDRPVFAFLNYYDAHSPYRSPNSYDAKFRSRGNSRTQGRLDAYESCIAFLDDQLRDLFQQLEQRGILRNTLVVITSDHGELFGEHGIARHGNSLYRPVLEVPLLIALPGTTPGGTRVRDVVSLRDVASTVADLAGLETSEPVPGRSLRRYWTSDTARVAAVAAPESVVSEVSAAIRQPGWLNATGPMVSVVENGMHYIKNFGRNKEELYDFVNDRDEMRNLADSPDGAVWLPHFRLRVGSPIDAN